MKISTRQHTWHRRSISAVKKLLRSKYVFRWAVLGFRLFVEIRKLIAEMM